MCRNPLFSKNNLLSFFRDHITFCYLLWLLSLPWRYEFMLLVPSLPWRCHLLFPTITSICFMMMPFTVSYYPFISSVMMSLSVPYYHFHLFRDDVTAVSYSPFVSSVMTSLTVSYFQFHLFRDDFTSCFLSSMQTKATCCANMLGTTCCVRLHTMLGYVA